MEVLVAPEFWRGRRVFLTGHTGFKGSWLALWLHELGARVTGYALAAEHPCLFEQARVGEVVEHHEGDIRDPEALESVMRACDPEVVFHLAAQPLVRRSYAEPRETFATNVQGTVNVLDACRRMPALKAIVAVTSDKCYENREWIWPYRENDSMGGHDPYSASKGAAEIAIAAYRRSFFAGEGPLLASLRSGNVIGGGDWADDRLIPDIVRAILAGEQVRIRSPQAVRPWQHVLETLRGYLLIAQQLANGDRLAASAWNFGPADNDMRPVSWIVERIVELWGQGSFCLDDAGQVHEAKLLKLDCSKARSQLGWRPSLELAGALQRIVEWHRSVAEGADARDISRRQLNEYRSLIDRSCEGCR